MTTIPEISGGGVLGEKVLGPRRQLDTFELSPNVETVCYKSDEVMSVCPITGQPDWYEVEIYIFASKKGLESKSLKLYLQSFMNEGQFCEAFADTIAKDVRQAVNGTASVEVIVNQKPRGGVSIHATARIG